MKYSAKEFGINERTGVDQQGAVTSNKVFIEEIPSAPQQAVSKQYVENINTTYDSLSFTEGYLPNSVLPNYTGDLNKPQGTTLVSLLTNVVTPGVFTKVLVNTKGQVTLGTVLSETDIPNINFTTITTLPNTLSAYSINNALPVTGGTMQGLLKVTQATALNDLVNKSLADSYRMDTSIEVGTYVLKTNKTFNPFFLKCDGSDILINDYLNLFSVIGETFTNLLSPGFGLPFLYQYNFNTNINTTGSWTTQGTIPATRNAGKILVTKNKVFLIGGRSTVNNSGSQSTIYISNIDPVTGVIGSWSTYGNLPAGLDSFELVTYKNFVYIIGGNSNGVISSSIIRTTIDVEGFLGSWINVGNLPAGIRDCSCFVSRNLLTLIGGRTPVGVSNLVMQSIINPDGSLSEVIDRPNLPDVRQMASVLPTKNWVYLIGGNSGSASLNTVIRAPISVEGLIGDWSSFNTLPAQRQESRIFATQGRVFLIGGGTSASNGTSNTVYTATLNTEGVLSGWTTGTALGEAVRNAHIFITNNRLYICGGYRSTTLLTSVRYTTFAGGLNDYSEWYSKERSATTFTFFRIPTRISNLIGTEYFIRV